MLENVGELIALNCGHGCCNTCWQGYLHCQVDGGKACVQARCPQHKCRLVVPAGFFQRFCDAPRAKRYEDWCFRTYVEDNPAVKWCTNPAGCTFACECRVGGPIEIRCGCNFAWCWGCGEEAHRPADCGLVSQWNAKNSIESENIQWIKSNTKKCPKCRKPIEKNQGCNHMRCTQNGGCGHEFCWICLGDWSKHGQDTGGSYRCNIYNESEQGRHKGDGTNEEDKDELGRYMFYFERFSDHDRGMKLTESEKTYIDGKTRILHAVHGFDVADLQFLYDALKQVRVCKRVLKWTYVYSFYLTAVGPERNLFEHLQKDLEEKTDSLHEMLENDLDRICPTDAPVGTRNKAAGRLHSTVRAEFAEFTLRVANLTHVTQQFLAKILADLGAGESLVCS